MDAPLNLIVARWFFFASAAILFGSSLFGIYAPNESGSVLAWRFKPASRGLSVVALVAAAAWLLALSHELDGASDPLVTAWTVLTQTTFGLDFATRLAFATVAAAAAAFDARRIVLAASAILLICEGGDGHAAAHGWLGESVQALHVLAAGCWIGGLFPLASALIAARRQDASAATAPIVLRFSTIAAIAVVVVLATGVVNVLLVRPNLAFANLYARVLALKLSLVAAMIALAAYNRWRLTPLLAKDQGRGGARALIAAVICEEALGLAALAAVAWLGLLDPYMANM